MTPFAKKVYKVVLAIPIGQVRSYKWVAQRVGNPKAARAVGQILKNNPCPLIVPCHRVVKSNQDLGGYVFGVKMKSAILDLEKRLKRCLWNKK
jgi:methylated-DNA-[protein]-cysteine S-methyltransferase